MKLKLRRGKPLDLDQCPESPSTVTNDNSYLTIQQFGDAARICKLVNGIILKRMAKHMVSQDVRRSIIIDGDMDNEQRETLKQLLDEYWSNDHDGVRCLSATTTKMAGKNVLFYTFVRPITP